MATAFHVPTGHVGNLTSEQEEKLRDFWRTVYKLNDVYDAHGAPNGSATPAQLQRTTTASSQQSQSSRWGLFRRSTAEPASPQQTEVNATAQELDRLGLPRELHDVLSHHTPDTIRSMVIGAVKHEHPDSLALRFLRARKWDLDKALVMMFAAMDWRYREARIDQDVIPTGDGGALEAGEKGDVLSRDFVRQCRSGKSFAHGTDREGRPICYIRVRLHKSSDQVPESVNRYCTYLIETTRLTLNPPCETANLLFDMTDFTLANMDYPFVKFLIKCFEANYPESLGVILIHNAPWVFKGIWKMISGWMDPVIRSKVNFTYGSKDLDQFIAPEQLLKELGGEEDWDYTYLEPVPGENDLMKDTETRDRILKERKELASQFEVATQKWIKAEGTQAEELKDERNRLAAELRANYWRLDPYVRARCVLDRQGVIQGGKPVVWYPDVREETAVEEIDTKEKATVNAAPATVAAPSAAAA
ncbi:phosphatidylinositol transfer protein csr1 [Purpureocillium takamizusanense]|uniref:Phosphatidylinositol transfer protein csr1 n=1 Tax=Purpureocillium takamizusanense TaxID=2060973 RepID=A0A9Q8QKT5_9HYPO|nr:phosphatidylinositol transfer protein csr1 [Purpureocillium takamizusanense]UNI21435.1 phosphatidylinositol transfer protein csr1 [Purpureocillium takamizusanense]